MCVGLFYTNRCRRDSPLVLYMNYFFFVYYERTNSVFTSFTCSVCSSHADTSHRMNYLWEDYLCVCEFACARARKWISKYLCVSEPLYSGIRATAVHAKHMSRSFFFLLSFVRLFKLAKNLKEKTNENNNVLKLRIFFFFNFSLFCQVWTNSLQLQQNDSMIQTKSRRARANINIKQTGKNCCVGIWREFMCIIVLVFRIRCCVFFQFVFVYFNF